MDRKKELKRAWRDQQRAVERARFPLEVDELEAMFDALEGELSRRGCDRSRTLTQAWLETRGHDVTAVCAWLDEHGGFCDCEVLANARQAFREAKTAPPIH